MLPVAILAGGLATRLRPLTETVPKSMVIVGGKPFIEHQLQELARQGVKKIILCTGFLGNMIEDFVGSGSKFGMEVSYSRETNQLLGTGGALLQALSLLEENFFVLYGDSWLDIDYKAVEKKYFSAGKSGLMSVFKNHGRWDTSNVEIRHQQIHLYSKTNRNVRMTHIDYGLGILSKDVFKDYPTNEKFDLSIVYETLSEKKDLACFESEKRFYEIGSIKGLEELDSRLRGTDE